MKKIFFAFALCAITFSLSACQAPCNHTPIEFKYNDSVHWAMYDCSNCDINPRRDPHVDDDTDLLCDVCGYEIHA